MVSAATEAAVIASISTPVGPVVRASAAMSTRPSPTSIRTSTKLSASGWHSGISSAVRLAAWIPAIRAVPTTSPFGPSPRATAVAVAGVMSTTARATARRSVASLPPTSTIRARPAASRCVRSSGRLVRLLRRRDQVADRRLVTAAEQLDRVGLAAHNRLEEDLAVLVGGEHALRPPADLVQHDREPRVGLAVLVGDLVADALGQRGAGARRGDRDGERAGADDGR